ARRWHCTTAPGADTTIPRAPGRGSGAARSHRRPVRPRCPGEGKGTAMFRFIGKDGAATERRQREAAIDGLARRALDVVVTNVMIANPAGVIVYANPGVLEMLRNAEADIRKQLP